MTINEYIAAVRVRFSSGISTEHSYRADLQALVQSFASDCSVTNEPRRQACGAPDYIIERAGIPVGFIEAKDVGIDLDKTAASEQLERYRGSLENLILTDYLEFRLFRAGVPAGNVRIGAIENGKVKSIPENHPLFEAMIRDFVAFAGVTITDPDKLARMMADKARLMEEIIVRALESAEGTKEPIELETAEEDDSLCAQFEAFKSVLIHDLSVRQFADIYAQTIAYGLFAARLNDPSIDSFTRQEAGYLVPKTNPFLFQLFTYIAGPSLDLRISWVVDALAEVFRACDVHAILSDFGADTHSTDPFIHFYETFLAEYDPALRKSRGVYYTPEPVVSFIVRSVDAILRRDFGLAAGLADTSMTEIEVEGFQNARQKTPGKVKTQVHRVQILDPAAGTGTFLVEVFRRIHERFQGQEGLWRAYVEEGLLPRVHGFEILMAPYAMCHLKLGMFLSQTGYVPKDPARPKRLGVYLTNSLEEAHPDAGSLFAGWLTKEAQAATKVKRDAPVMVVLGNPPYANFGGMNKGEWIRSLIADYKKDLNEKKINLDDDYIKFIRYAEHYIEKNGHGVVAMITNNSYIDGITHRRMRQHLMETFDDIYVLDLHGSTKKKETAPDGGKDENVFDIQQGVAIVLMIRKDSMRRGVKKNAVVRHAELYGLREVKYHALWSHDIESTKWKLLEPEEPNWFFVPKNLQEDDSELFLLSKLFNESNNGIKTDRDVLFVDYDPIVLKNRINTLLSESLERDFIEKYNVIDSGSYTITKKISGKVFSSRYVFRYHYNPFDFRFIYYDPEIISRPARKVSQAIIAGVNYGLVVGRQASVIGTEKYDLCFLVNKLVDTNLFRRGGNAVFPLYLYPESRELEEEKRRPNLNPDIVTDIAGRMGLRFLPDHEHTEAGQEGRFTPLDLLDYIYAVLHAPSYREKYREFLKIDFPRVPYPKNAQHFFALAEKGSELRALHLLESPKLGSLLTTYPENGTNSVDKTEWEGTEEPDGRGRVRINAAQYFESVPRRAWDFWIGGYQPARKWLKDRKGRNLSFEDILHWQRVIVALTETARIMGEIDDVYRGAEEVE